MADVDVYAPRLLRETVDWAAFYKPPGRETVSETGQPDLLGALAELMPGLILIPVHRLDRDTSGVQLLAKNEDAAERLAALFRRREVDKEYLAVCLGAPGNRAGRINRDLSPWRGGRRPVRVVKGGGGLAATTEYRVLAASVARDGVPKISMIAFSPHQGRTHQIRVHAAALGYPVLGDDQYGDRAANKWAKEVFGLRRQALHSRFLRFMWGGERWEVACPLPADLAAVAAAAFPDLTL